MYKKTVTYVDYDGVERTESFYFNLTKAELTNLELTTEGTMTSMIKKIIEENDIPRLITLFQKIIDISYGVKSDDGKRFMKNPELLAAFKENPAYSEIYMSLIENDNAAAEFVNGIMPKDLQDAMNQGAANIISVPVG